MVARRRRFVAAPRRVLGPVGGIVFSTIPIEEIAT
jgi:hypothetical protein